MSYSTEQLLQLLDGAIKGITTTTTLGATVLEPQQFDRYVRALMHKTSVLPRFRFMRMDSNIVDIDRIAFGQRIMGVEPAEGTPKSTSDFVSPSFAQHKLTAVGMQGVVSLTDKMLRRNPERQALMQTVMDLIGERGGLDIEEQGIKGDTGSSDPFLALNEGWLVQTRRRCPEVTNQAYDDGAVPSFTTGAGETTAIVYYDKLPITEGTFELYETNTTVPPGVFVADEDGDGILDQVGGSGVGGSIDYESGKISLTGLTAAQAYAVKFTAAGFDKAAAAFPENMFDNLIRVVPKEYFRAPGEWEIEVPWWVLKAYRNRLKARFTSLGDEFYQQGSSRIRVPYEDVWINYVPNMPNNKAWLTHPDNTIYGVFHEVTVETEREAKAKRTDIIIDCETDYGYEEPEATVVADIY